MNKVVVEHHTVINVREIHVYQNTRVPRALVAVDRNHFGRRPIAEAHREDVWQRVQARIETAESEKRGLFRWPFRRRHREADDFGATLDRMALGEPIWEAKDSNLQDLLHVARVRQAAATSALAGFAEQQARVWARLRPRLMARLGLSRRRRVFRRNGTLPWPKLVGAAAAVVLAAAALGPIPATGLAHHPVAGFARFLGDHLGVRETSAPPTVPPVKWGTNPLRQRSKVDLPPPEAPATSTNSPSWMSSVTSRSAGSEEPG